MGKKLQILCMLTAIILIFALPGCRTVSTGNLKVTVIDSSGSYLAGAKVVSQEQPGSQLKVTGLTGSNGVVEFDGIRQGQYTFIISRFDYIQAEINITVSGGATTDYTAVLISVSP